LNRQRRPRESRIAVTIIDHRVPQGAIVIGLANARRDAFPGLIGIGGLHTLDQQDQIAESTQRRWNRFFVLLFLTLLLLTQTLSVLEVLRVRHAIHRPALNLTQLLNRAAVALNALHLYNAALTL